MKQIENSKLCKYCYGCNRLELEEFEGVKHCKNFIEAYIDWVEKYNEALMEENKNDM